MSESEIFLNFIFGEYSFLTGVSADDDFCGGACSGWGGAADLLAAALSSAALSAEALASVALSAAALASATLLAAALASAAFSALHAPSPSPFGQRRGRRRACRTSASHQSYSRQGASRVAEGSSREKVERQRKRAPEERHHHQQEERPHQTRRTPKRVDGSAQWK